MSGIYTVQARTQAIQDLRDGAWQEIKPASISHYPWGNTYMPRAEARMYYTENGLHVRFQAYEKEIRTVYAQMNDPVYKDSCMELFVNPNPEHDDRYMNFEINAIGAMLIGFGRPGDRVRLTPGAEKEVGIQASLERESADRYQGDSWLTGLFIPFDFLNKYYGEIPFSPGWKMKGNFYKCGDETRIPHYGCWNRIGLAAPQFHCPEYFGTIELE